MLASREQSATVEQSPSQSNQELIDLTINQCSRREDTVSHITAFILRRVKLGITPTLHDLCEAWGRDPSDFQREYTQAMSEVESLGVL